MCCSAPRHPRVRSTYFYGVAMYEVTTESGSVYEIDKERGFWRKQGDLYERIWIFAHIDPDNLPETWDEMNALPNADKPEVGMRMYLSGKNMWRITSKIVDVKEVER